jgi:DNA-binding response OmpR family regulator
MRSALLSGATSVGYHSFAAAGIAAMWAGSATDAQESCGLPSSFLNGATKAMDTGTTALVYEFGESHLDAVRRVLRSRMDGRPIDLPPRAFDTLLFLVEHAGALVEKHVLMDAVWSNVVVEEGHLTQTIYLLRRALGRAARRASIHRHGAEAGL